MSRRRKPQHGRRYARPGHATGDSLTGLPGLIAGLTEAMAGCGCPVAVTQAGDGMALSAQHTPGCPGGGSASSTGHQTRRTGGAWPARQAWEAAALSSARLGGCVCDPDIEMAHVDGERRIRVRHDDWCPMLGAGPGGIVVAHPPDGNRP